METISLIIILGLTALLMTTITGISIAITKNIRSGEKHAAERTQGI